MSHPERRPTVVREGYRTPFGLKEFLTPESFEEIARLFVKEVILDDYDATGLLIRRRHEDQRCYDIHISKKQSLKEQVKTFVHEVAHIYLGPVGESGRATGYPPPNLQEEMKIEEDQAEKEMKRFYRKNWRIARKLFTEYTGVSFTLPKN